MSTENSSKKASKASTLHTDGMALMEAGSYGGLAGKIAEPEFIEVVAQCLENQAAAFRKRTGV